MQIHYLSPTPSPTEEIEYRDYFTGGFAMSWHHHGYHHRYAGYGGGGYGFGLGRLLIFLLVIATIFALVGSFGY